MKPRFIFFCSLFFIFFLLFSPPSGAQQQKAKEVPKTVEQQKPVLKQEPSYEKEIKDLKRQLQEAATKADVNSLRGEIMSLRSSVEGLASQPKSPQKSPVRDRILSGSVIILSGGAILGVVILIYLFYRSNRKIYTLKREMNQVRQDAQNVSNWKSQIETLESQQSTMNSNVDRFQKQFASFQSTLQQISAQQAQLEQAATSVKLESLNPAIVSGVVAGLGTILDQMKTSLQAPLATNLDNSLQEIRSMVSEITRVKPSLENLNANLAQVQVGEKLVQAIASEVSSKVKTSLAQYQENFQKTLVTQLNNSLQELRLLTSGVSQMKPVFDALSENLVLLQSELSRFREEGIVIAKEAPQPSQESVEREPLQAEVGDVRPIRPTPAPVVEAPPPQADQMWLTFLEFIKPHLKDVSPIEAQINKALAEGKNPAQLYDCFNMFVQVIREIYIISTLNTAEVNFEQFVRQFQGQLQLEVRGLEAEGRLVERLGYQPKIVSSREFSEIQRKIYEKKLSQLRGTPSNGQVIAVLSPGVKSTHREWESAPEVAVFGW